MQTFLPYASFERSASCLDRMRLGKQRVENLQIMRSLIDGGGWANHPATKMWSGYELSLLDYQTAICHEWSQIRGYKDTCLAQTEELVDYYEGTFAHPWWLGDDEFHASHRSNLLRKMPEHYGQFGWSEPDDLPYIWPSR